MGNGGGTFACNPRENCRYPRNISANYSPRRNGRVVLEQSRRYAYNLKCFKMEIKRRLRAFCKATRRALEYIIEQCQHLFLITFRWSTRPWKFLSLEFYRLSVAGICEIFFHLSKNFILFFFYSFFIHPRKDRLNRRLSVCLSLLRRTVSVTRLQQIIKILKISRQVFEVINKIGPRRDFQNILSLRWLILSLV